MTANLAASADQTLVPGPPGDRPALHLCLRLASRVPYPQPRLIMTDDFLYHPQAGDGADENSSYEEARHDVSPGCATHTSEPISASPSGPSSGAQSPNTRDAEALEIMDSRAYQLEMLKRSLEGNVIIAVCQVVKCLARHEDLFTNDEQMDTGSGKTQV